MYVRACVCVCARVCVRVCVCHCLSVAVPMSLCPLCVWLRLSAFPALRLRLHLRLPGVFLSAAHCFFSPPFLSITPSLYTRTTHAPCPYVYSSRLVQLDWTFFSSAYFSIVTMSTVGYGDLSADTVFGRVSVVIFIIFGVVFFSLQTSDLLELMSIGAWCVSLRR